MNKKQDFAQIVGVEIPDGLKELNRTQDARGNFRTALRIIVSFAENNMTDAQKKMYERATPEQRRIMNANKIRLQYSGLFNAENIILDTDGNPFVTPDGGLTDEQQTKVLQKVKDTFKNCGNTAIFTLYDFSIAELTEGKHTKVETENGTQISSRSRLFFEFFDDDETAKRMVQNSLQNHIENGSLSFVESAPANTESEHTNTLNL